MKILDKVLSKIALPLIMVAGVILVISIALSAQGTNNENNAYIRVINCVISIPAITRTQTDIENCYRTVERDLHVDLQRYDSSAKE